MLRRSARPCAVMLCALGVVLAGCSSGPAVLDPIAPPVVTTVNWPQAIVPPAPAPSHAPGLSTRPKKGALIAVGRDYLVSADLTGDAKSDPPVFVALYSQSLSTGEVRTLNFWGDWRQTEIGPDGVGTDFVVAARFDGTKSAVDVVPLDGSLAYPRLELVGLKEVSVRGELAFYVLGGTNTALGGAGEIECARSFAGRVWGPAYCKPVS